MTNYTVNVTVPMMIQLFPNAENRQLGITKKQVPIVQIWSVEGNGQEKKGLETIASGLGQWATAIQSNGLL